MVQYKAKTPDYRQAGTCQIHLTWKFKMAVVAILKKSNQIWWEDA